MWRINPEVAISKFIKSNVAISVTDNLGRIIYANKGFCNILDCDENELLGVSNTLFKTKFHKDVFYKNLWESVDNGMVWKGELTHKSKNGMFYNLETTIVPLKDANGEVESLVTMYLDITNSKKEISNLKRIKEAG